MSVEFDTPANRIIAQFQTKNQFGIDTSLPDIAFLRQMSVQGRMRYFTGSHTTAISIVPNIGETLFIGGGEYFCGGSSVRSITVSNDGNTRESFNSLFVGVVVTGKFTFGLDSLVGDGAKAFTVTGSGAQCLFNIWAWIENTSRIRDVAT